MPDARPAAGGFGSDAERSANPRSGTATLESLQGARGIAAVLVVLYHCSTAIFGLAKYAPGDPFHRAFASGRFGVELFFVISGFIIFSTHRHDVSRPRRLGSFLRKRFLRIYPVYWVVLAALLPAYAAMPRLGDGSALRPLTILSSLTLVHVGTPSMVLGVSWTLCFEILFYALFATLILDRRLGIAVLAVWWGLAVLRAVSGSALLAAYPFSDYTLLFPARHGGVVRLSAGPCRPATRPGLLRFGDLRRERSRQHLRAASGTGRRASRGGRLERDAARRFRGAGAARPAPCAAPAHVSRRCLLQHLPDPLHGAVAAGQDPAASRVAGDPAGLGRLAPDPDVDRGGRRGACRAGTAASIDAGGRPRPFPSPAPPDRSRVRRGSRAPAGRVVPQRPRSS